MCVKQSEQAVESEERLSIEVVCSNLEGREPETQKTRETTFERLWHAYCFHLSVLFTQYLRGANC